MTEQNKSGIPAPPEDDVLRVVETALAEDLGREGDITTAAVVPSGSSALGKLVAKESGVIAGLQVASTVFHTVNPALNFEALAEDGEAVIEGREIAEVSGPAADILIAERTALNLLCHLSGIASLTARYVAAVQGFEARILDTRKTTPGLRTLEKYAVVCGGGTNHRIGLFDAVLIKENHIAAAGSLTAAVRSAREKTDLPVQVEVENLEQLREAIAAGANSVLLDNMTPDKTKEAVTMARSEASDTFLLESSGGINLENVRDYAAAGVDRISIGALTHSAKALDISLRFKYLPDQ